ncbi:hypothetical protein OsI_15343 [Oryza sativa Indica Group]|jgi:hypothetical protein|uniref:Uncharacterized protein n=1 Tax=Oryza sativa subsp. indica TaxID=39946 RepID=A2XRU3_ORYSI|nr:hypothetical protein OsI_15343 [Oryza sativa Indica Group]
MRCTAPLTREQIQETHLVITSCRRQRRGLVAGFGVDDDVIAGDDELGFVGHELEGLASITSCEGEPPNQLSPLAIAVSNKTINSGGGGGERKKRRMGENLARMMESAMREESMSARTAAFLSLLLGSPPHLAELLGFFFLPPFLPLLSCRAGKLS